VTSRTFVIGYLSSIIKNTSVESAVFGLGLITQLINSIPRVFFPGKFSLLSELRISEGLINPSFGIINIDSPVTAVVESYADFLFIGSLIYPLIFYILGYCLFLTTKVFLEKTKSGSIGLIYLFSYVSYTFIHVEQAFSFYVVSIRNLLVICLVLYLFLIFFGPLFKRSPTTSKI